MTTTDADLAAVVAEWRAEAAVLGMPRLVTNWRDIPSDHPACVYALVDPRTPRAPRYVGASRSLRERLHSHCKTLNGKSVAFRAWIESLRADGVAPALFVVSLHEDYEAARKAEWRLMQRWERRGVTLTSAPSKSIAEKYLGARQWRVAA